MTAVSASDAAVATRAQPTTAMLLSKEFEIDVVVEAVELAATGVAVLTLRNQAGGNLPTWSPGAHIDLIMPDGKLNQYSLCGVPGDWRTWRLGVLLDMDGSGVSRYIHEDLQAGDVLRTRGPRNHFRLSDAPHYLFIAGGIGITPILAMVQAVETQGKEWKLVYGGRTRESMAFVDELDRYGDRVTIWPQDEKGLMELQQLIQDVPPEGLTYCCGPQPLLEAIEKVTKGWPPKRLRVERFSAKPIDRSNDKPLEVRLERSGMSLHVPAHESILSAVRAAGVSTVSSCGKGTCGTCETMVLEGVVEHRDSVLDEEEREEGDSIMICVSRARSDRLVLDL